MSYIEIYRAAKTFATRQGLDCAAASDYAAMVANGELPVIDEILNVA